MAVTAQSERFATAERLLADAIARCVMPGCAYGVYAGGQVVAKALGGFTYEAESPRVLPATRFDVASVTKVVATTAAAMLLVQQGLMDVSQPIGELLPGFIIGREDTRWARKVTLAQLLAHSSGLPGYVELFRTAKTSAELLKACLELPIEAEPGTRAEYSDPGFMLLGKVIEVITREPLDVWTAREVFQPLGMLATGFTPVAGERALIPPTEMDETFRMRMIQGEVQDENAAVMKGVAGHAGLFANVEDLLRFAAAVIAGDALFNAETVARFAERQLPKGSSRALGWDTPLESGSSAGQFYSARSIGHLGYSGCSLWIDLEGRIAIVLLTNRTWPERSEQSHLGIKELRPRFHDAVREALR